MKRILAGILFAGAVTTSVAAAAHGGGRGDRMEAHLIESLKKDASLDDATVARVKSALDARDKEKEAAATRMKDAMKALRALVDSGSKDEAAYEKGLGEVKAAREQMRVLHEQDRAEMEKLLTAEQRAKLLVNGKGKFRRHHE